MHLLSTLLKAMLSSFAKSANYSDLTALSLQSGSSRHPHVMSKVRGCVACWGLTGIS